MFALVASATFPLIIFLADEPLLENGVAQPAITLASATADMVDPKRAGLAMF
jgi:hypothetical protein